jgi:hypothetical protein
VTHFLFNGQNKLVLDRALERRAGQIAAWPFVDQILLCVSFRYYRENVEFSIRNVVTVKRKPEGEAVIAGKNLV